MVKLGDGSGPGGHPGVQIVKLTGDPVADRAALEAAYESGGEFQFTYPGIGSETFAVFANGYKSGNS